MTKSSRLLSGRETGLRSGAGHLARRRRSSAEAFGSDFKFGDGIPVSMIAFDQAIGARK